jgi:hypothetical protein
VVRAKGGGNKEGERLKAKGARLANMKDLPSPCAFSRRPCATLKLAPVLALERIIFRSIKRQSF